MDNTKTKRRKKKKVNKWKWDLKNSLKMNAVKLTTIPLMDTISKESRLYEQTYLPMAS